MEFLSQTLKSAIIVLFGIGSANAEDLMAVYQLAAKNDANIQAAEFSYQASSEDIIQARAALIPELYFDASHSETDQEITDSQNPVFHSGSASYSTQTYGLTISVPIFRYEAWKRYAQSKATVKQAKAEFLAAEQQLMLNTAESYFGVLAAKDNLEFARAERAAIERQLELAQARNKKGLTTITNLRDAQARYAASEAQVVVVGDTLEDAYRELQEYTSVLVVDFSVLQEEIPLAPPQPAIVTDWISTSLKQSYDLEALRHAIAAAMEEVKRQQAGHLPTVDLVGTLNNRDADGSLFGGGSEVRTGEVVLNFNLPLYSGGSTSSQAREANFRYQQVMREYEAQRRSLDRETRNAFRGVLSGIKEVESLKKTVLFQRSALDVKEQGLKSGLNTTIEVLDAQRDLHRAKRGYSQARYNYLLSILRLKRSAGTLAPDDLKMLNTLLTSS